MYESVNLDENKNKVLDRDISSTEVLNRVYMGVVCTEKNSTELKI
jgi:hypothetical protein